MAKHEEGFTVGAIERGLAEAVTGKKKRKSPSVFDRDIAPPHRVGTVAPTVKNDPVGRFHPDGTRKSLLERVAERRERAAGTATRRTTVDVPDSPDFKTRKANAGAKAESLGHTLGKWKKRAGDRYGREDAHCATCDDSVTVCVMAPLDYNLPVVYGDAVTRECVKS